MELKTLNGYGFDATKLGGLNAQYYAQGRAAHNLLDNSYFKKKREIVNQRGKTSYSGGGYTIDRWVLYDPNGDGSLVINDGYISLTGGSGDVSLSCRFPKGIIDANKTYTKVICDNQGNINPCSLFSYDSFDSFEFSAAAGETKNIVWAALYEGSCTADTLPAYVPKGYAAELAECQRYYYKVPSSYLFTISGYSATATSARLTIPTPVPMRVNPTVTVDDLSAVRILTANGAVVPTAISFGARESNAIALLMDASGMTAWTSCTARFATNVSLSADL